MKKKISLLFFVILPLFISSCVNLSQKTTVMEDGSGVMDLHYWTKNSNLSMGDEIGGFGFTEEKARRNYSTSNTEVKSIKVENSDRDSTTHVQLVIEFKDINKLSETPGFSKIKAGWVKGDKGTDFKYILSKDTLNAKNMGMDAYSLDYKFIFPGEILSANGTIDGNTVEWKKTVADLKEDVVMTATIKPKSKTCGVFGFEFPVVFILLLFYRKLSGDKYKSCIKSND